MPVPVCRALTMASRRCPNASETAFTECVPPAPVLSPTRVAPADALVEVVDAGLVHAASATSAGSASSRFLPVRRVRHPVAVWNRIVVVSGPVRDQTRSMAFSPDPTPHGTTYSIENKDRDAVANSH
jgi:hypothetical protein